MAPRDAIALAIDPDNGVRAEAAALNARHGDLEASAAVELAVTELFPGKVALVSSFGAESAVLLHLVAEIDRKVPVIFLDTGRLFAETLEYRTKLVETLGLGDVRTVTPDPQLVIAGFFRSTPAAVNTCSSSVGDFIVPSAFRTVR